MGKYFRKAAGKLAACLAAAALMMPGTVSAAVHDPVQDVSSDTAVITLGKILEVSQENKFPNISDFTFEIEAVRGWENANTASSASGAEIAASDLPMPLASAAAHQNVTVSGTTASVTVGNFSAGNASQGGVADTALAKLRTTAVRIPFDKAGYYLYRVTETGSQPAQVPGITYDDNSYYITVYVCNCTDADGNTTGGVYVHNITSWRSAPGEEHVPDLTDIANVTDNGGTAAASNAQDQYAKVGVSDPTPGTDPDGNPTGPDKLAAYRFWNEQITRDLILTNNVTGNLGDITKEFEFEITLSGLEKGATYTMGIPAEGSGTMTSEGTGLISASAGALNTADRTLTADADGNAAMLVRLQDDEVLVLNALPVTANYAVNERASDHVASYTITSDGEEAVIAQTADENQRDNTALATREETVDRADQTVTIAYSNHRNLATPTGIPENTLPVVLLGIAGACAALVRRAGRSGQDE